MQYLRGQPLEARVRTLDRLARWADTAIRSWELVETSTDEGEVSDLLFRYRPYLVVSGHGHRDLGLLYLNALFERRNDTVNFWAVCSHLRKHGVSVDQIDADMRAHQSALKKLHTLRGGAIGHRTAARSYDETFAAVQMTKDELDSLVALAARSANAIAKLIMLPPAAPRIDPVTCLQEMLQQLAEAERHARATDPWN